MLIKLKLNGIRVENYNEFTVFVNVVGYYREISIVDTIRYRLQYRVNFINKNVEP